jgi:hypothetical protein
MLFTHLIRTEADGSVKWFGAFTDIEAAKARIQEEVLLTYTLRRGPLIAGSRPPLQRRSNISRLHGFSSPRRESAELLGGRAHSY